MNRSRALWALLALFGATAAIAGDDPHTRYQEALLRRKLAPADDSLCRNKTGENRQALERCHVTRNFIADLLRKAEQGYPPLTDIRYVLTKEEKNLLLDKLTAFGG